MPSNPDATVADNLHFYFLGNAAVTGTLTEGETTSLSISIADQSGNLPVFSYGASEQTYSAANTSYSATLRNQCALVRFDLVNQGDYTVTLSGVPTLATVDFANNAIPTPIPRTTSPFMARKETPLSDGPSCCLAPTFPLPSTPI
ncbi:MAG: hypothetical protein K6G92_02200 [Bacteroidaceae bacterium]|nr:hypothetical protein [Bacteroidaceae bacterium]